MTRKAARLRRRVSCSVHLSRHDGRCDLICHTASFPQTFRFVEPLVHVVIATWTIVPSLIREAPEIRTQKLSCLASLCRWCGMLQIGGPDTAKEMFGPRTHTHTHAHTLTHTHAHARTHTHTLTHACTCTHTHTLTHTHHAHTHTHSYMHTHTHTHMHAHSHKHARSHTHTHTHTY